MSARFVDASTDASTENVLSACGQLHACMYTQIAEAAVQSYSNQVVAMTRLKQAPGRTQMTAFPGSLHFR